METRITVFNEQDKILARTQATLTVAAEGLLAIAENNAEALSSVELAQAVVGLAEATEAIRDLRMISGNLSLKAEAVHGMSDGRHRRFDHEVAMWQPDPSITEASCTQLIEELVRRQAAEVAVRQLAPYSSLKVCA